MENLCKPRQDAYDKLGPRVAKALEARHFKPGTFQQLKKQKKRYFL